MHRQRRQWEVSEMKKRELFIATATILVLILVPGTGNRAEASSLLTDAAGEDKEEKIDFSDTEDNDDVPLELQDKVLTEELQEALRESMRNDDYDPEEAFDGAENVNPALDPTDGEPLYIEDDGGSEEDQSKEFEAFISSIMIDDHPELEISFDEENERYVYSFPDGRRFSMTAPLGCISNEPVKVTLLDDIGFMAILKNGEEIFETPSEVTGFTAKDEGNYLFTVLSSRSGIDDSGNYEIRGGFRIIGAGSVEKISLIGTPAGMELKSITRNGKKVHSDRPGYALLSTDGEYDLLYTLKGNSKVSWNVKLRRDTTAPMLLFSEDLKEQILYRPVSYQTIRKDTTVRVFRNNSEISPDGNTVSDDGYYRIEAGDPMGNIRIYSFVIARGMGVDFRKIAIFAGILAACALIVVLTARRSMRII